MTMRCCTSRKNMPIVGGQARHTYGAKYAAMDSPQRSFSRLGVSLRRCPRAPYYRRLLQRERCVSRLQLYERDLEWCNIAGRSRSSETAFWAD